MHVGSLESVSELLETNSQNKHFSALLGSLTTRDFDTIHLGTREISGRDYRDFFITTLKKNSNNNNNHLERLASHYQCLFWGNQKNWPLSDF